MVRYHDFSSLAKNPCINDVLSLRFSLRFRWATCGNTFCHNVLPQILSLGFRWRFRWDFVEVSLKVSLGVCADFWAYVADALAHAGMWQRPSIMRVCLRIQDALEIVYSATVDID